MLVSLVYVSSATSKLDARALLGILEHVRPRNDAVAVTGVLLYSGGNIIQVLEGPAEAVNQVYGAIWRDPRHTDVTVIWHESIGHRTFSDWSMGFRELRTVEADTVTGFTDFLRTGSTERLVQHADPTLILLEVFRDTAR